MTLARDERIGLTIAGVVAALALASFTYRQLRSIAPSAPEPAPTKAPVDDQAARDAYAATVSAAIARTDSSASATADGKVLAIRWDMCSKQMLHRLLHDEKFEQAKFIREQSGLSVKRLKSHGFTKASCDDGRKGLTPAVEKL